MSVTTATPGGGLDHAFDARLTAAVREGAVRGAVTVGLAGLAIIHAVDGVDKWSETRYVFWLYMAAIVVGAATLLTRSRASLLAAAGLSLSVLAGFVLSRTTGLPDATDDIGNRTEPLGLASMFVEASTALAALAALALDRRALDRR